MEERPAKWMCQGCYYVYDPEIGEPERGIPAGTSFENLPDDYRCPVCGAPKSMFDRLKS
ncbi:MAG: rubredoxin [candidate division Zixibacteria bacterium]|nr:rubredoxin [candidate division Zixibacteria bacterium]NIR63518.1 rubredoxin [candidate division Zixibacteria bacterium]NIS46191.1 rubredoxin [candidate division Zixibacteria bacterium]NIT52366.1 rubredoxin [candidate division Zixibacteria bacterium]NIU14293.1 rubredoxin [candidate division Zixibacteria bacterium]